MFPALPLSRFPDFPIFRFLDFPLFASALLLASTLSLQAQTHDAVNEVPIQLPTYTTTTDRDLPPPESWLYSRIPGFEVLSNAREGTTRDLLNNFQRFANAVNLVWPGMQPSGSSPAVLILCGRGDQFPAFMPGSGSGTERATTSLSYRTREQSAIVLDLQTKVLNLATDEGTAAGAAAVTTDENGVPSSSGADQGIAVDSYQQLYRQYLRFLLSGQPSKPPAWFAEGLAQLFMAMDVTEDSITLGKLEDPNAPTMQQEIQQLSGGSHAAPAQDRDFNAALARRALLPMQELFDVEPDSQQARNPLGSTWAKQSSAFVHWGLYGDEGRHQKEFVTFLARLGNEPATEALFKECFKKSYKQMLSALRDYIDYTRHKIAGVRAAKGQKLPEPLPVVLRPATESEVGRIKGLALGLSGHPAEARATLITAYRRGEREPALLAALGVAELAVGDTDRARRFLEVAVRGKAALPKAYLELARLRLAESLKKPQGAAGKLDTQQTSRVLELLFTGRDLQPPLPEIYEVMADTWLNSATPPSAGNLAAIEQGVKLFPQDTTLVYRAADLRGRHGYLKEAHSLIRLGLRVSPDAAARAPFERLQATLPPAAIR